MKRGILLIAWAVLLLAQDASAQAFKKYDIKSGIVTYDQVMAVDKTVIAKKIIIVYFDDFGMKECRETYTGDKLEQIYFSDGKDLVSVNVNAKTATRKGPASRGTELRVDWTDFGTQKDLDSGRIKKLPAKTIAGKSCEMFLTDDGKGTVATYGGWNKILMYMEVNANSVHTTQQAVKIEENAKVPPEKLKIPAGVTLK
jgi:hypothetical protein